MTAALFANAVPYLLFAVAEQTVHSPTAGIINATTPLWTVTLALAVRHQRGVTRVADGGADRRFCRGSAASHQRLATLAQTSTSISSIAFSRDGQEVAAGGHNGTVTLFTQRPLNPNQGFLSQLICGEVRENITRRQWADNAPGIPYQKTCPAYP